MTPEEITLTPEQERLMVEMITDIASTQTDLGQLAKIQKHMKIIWNHAVLEEREACANIAYKQCYFFVEQHSADVAIVCKNIAQAIRARGGE